jgi:hypothetical protein
MDELPNSAGRDDLTPGHPTLDDLTPRCSARGCRAPAIIELRWRNPALHDASRVKVWLACDEHTDSLAEFLSRRGFLLERGSLPADS